MAFVVYRDWIIQWDITRDGRVVVDIVCDWRASCPYDDGVGEWVSGSDTMGEIQGRRTVGGRTIIPLVDLDREVVGN